MTERAWLESCFAKAIEAVRGDRVIPPNLPIKPPPGGRLRVIALGKAALAMTRGALISLRESEALRSSSRCEHRFPIEGWVITKEKTDKEIINKWSAEFGLGSWHVMQGGHPIADERSARAGQALLDFVAHSRAEDRYLVLLSGGASALAVQPVTGLTLNEKSACVQALMRRGAPIAAINHLRRHLSQLKGGGLARAMAPAEYWTLAISDVPGDDPTVIGSAPTLDLPREPEMVVSILKEYDLWSEWQARLEPILRVAHQGVTGQGVTGQGVTGRGVASSSSSPPPAARYRIVARLDDALAAAEGAGRRAGLHTVNLGRVFYGDVATHVAAFCAAIRQVAAAAPSGGVLVLAAGEPTLQVTGSGLGGRAQHFALACAEALQGLSGVSVLAAGTDGSDGPTAAAGGCIDGESWAALQAAGVDPKRALRDFDSANALRAIKAQLHTGPTGTNVADLFLAVVHRAGDNIS